MKKTVTIEETADAMGGLARGSKPADMLSALRSSALSCRVQLINNAGYAIILRKYRGVRLPDVATLQAELSQAIRQDGTGKAAWGLMKSHLTTLYAIDDLWFSGQITLDYGCTLEEQRAWRTRMVDLIPGMGMKLVSWALFIYDPFACRLLTVDCIHCDRLGIDQTKLTKRETGRAFYCAIEDMCLQEAHVLYPMHLPVVAQACLWLNHRGQGLTDHSGITCRE